MNPIYNPYTQYKKYYFDYNDNSDYTGKKQKIFDYWTEEAVDYPKESKSVETEYYVRRVEDLQYELQVTRSNLEAAQESNKRLETQLKKTEATLIAMTQVASILIYNILERVVREQESQTRDLEMLRKDGIGIAREEVLGLLNQSTIVETVDMGNNIGCIGSIPDSETRDKAVRQIGNSIYFVNSLIEALNGILTDPDKTAALHALSETYWPWNVGQDWTPYTLTYLTGGTDKQRLNPVNLPDRIAECIIARAYQKLTNHERHSRADQTYSLPTQRDNQNTDTHITG